MPAPNAESIMGTPFNTVVGHPVEVPTHQEINEKRSFAIEDGEIVKEGIHVTDGEIQPASPYEDGSEHEKDGDSENHVIVTGADAAQYLLPIRDDHQPSLTFRSLFLATILSAFQSVMYQIYQVSQHFNICGR
jgi:hypothetical protein